MESLPKLPGRQRTIRGKRFRTAAGDCRSLRTMPPFESINEETKEIEGFDVDLANAIGKNWVLR